ncbi:MAG: thiol reductant ABC exporter subunit CydD [Gammaproteobacteria bacterium]|nr:thiol reductant ABC exporter subunit CydD [Gammaproteobacteria bacterium]
MAIPQFLKQQKSLTSRWLQIAIGLGLLSGFLLIVQAWFLAKTVNGVIFEGLAITDVQSWLWLLLLVFVVRALLAWASEQAAFHGAAKIKRHLRNRLHRHVQALGPVQSGSEHTGARVNTLVDGIEALENYYARYLPAMSLMVLVPFSILIFIFPTDWISGLVMLLTAPLIPVFMILIGKGTERLNKKQWRKLARMSAHFLDMIQGLTTLKIFNTSKHEAEVIARISEQYRQNTMSVLRVAFLSSLVLEFFATISIAIVAVLIGFRLFYSEMDFLMGFFVLLLAPEFYFPLRNMGTHYHARMEAIGAAEQMVELLDKPVYQSAEKTLPAVIDSVFNNQSIAIDISNVTFSYEKGRQALHDFSLTINAGQRIALVGASGAGKSTVVNLLLGFVRSSQGEIVINGMNLHDIPLTNWREQLAWVPQRPYLFYGSIADNIRLGNKQATDSEVKKAAALANCDEFIEALPESFNTHIGEKGEGLSGGQIQRIALARAFLKDAPLLILDEPTANLDKESEQLIQQSIDQLAQNRTVITIAHRLNTVEQADVIVVMDKGRLVEAGSHKQLLAETNNSHGLYQKMLATFVASQHEDAL